MWNIVNLCGTSRHRLVTHAIAIAKLTDAEDKEIPFTHYGGARYISRNLLIDEHITFQNGMRNAVTLLKTKTKTLFGLPGLSAFLSENDATHASEDPTVINRDRSLQSQSVHVDEFKICGDYVNKLQEIKSDIEDIMHGVTIPGSGVVVKYVCVEDLVSAIGDSVLACEKYVTESMHDGNFPHGFDPDDDQSVSAAIHKILNANAKNE
jgi:hypothetical protein